MFHSSGIAQTIFLLWPQLLLLQRQACLRESGGKHLHKPSRMTPAMVSLASAKRSRLPPLPSASVTGGPSLCMIIRFIDGLRIWLLRIIFSRSILLRSPGLAPSRIRRAGLVGIDFYVLDKIQQFFPGSLNIFP